MKTALLTFEPTFSFLVAKTQFELAADPMFPQPLTFPTSWPQLSSL